MMDPTRRIARWNAKDNTRRIPATSDDVRPNMLQNVTVVFPLLTAIRGRVKR